MRYSQSEKMQIIRLVEESPVSIKQTLLELVCLQKVWDKSGIKIREGFRSQIPSFSLLSNL